MASDSIPIVDFSRFDTDFEAVAKEIKNVCETWGFLYLKNHGLEQERIDRMFEISDYFFKKTSLEDKMSCPYDSIPNAGYDGKTGNEAYFQENGGKDVTSKKDGKEVFVLRKENCYDQPLPSTLQQHKSEIQGFMAETHEKIALRLLSCIAVGLGLDRGKLPQMCEYASPSITSLRLIHYPALEVGDEAPVRLGSHSDHGVITILFQHLISGLQVRPPKYSGPIQEGEQWINATVIPGTVLVNIGETMTFFSGGLMKSTMHRVTRSPHPEEKHKERFSMAYFCHPNQDTLLEVLDGIKGGVKREPPISCVTGQQIKTVKDWIEHRHSLGRLQKAN